MRDIGNGYGSKYHLLDYLNNRLPEINNLIKDQTILTGDFDWHFPDPDSPEKEYRGIEFLHKKGLVKNWKEFWASRGNVQNWDAVLKTDQGYVLVEAKAHIGELKSDCKAKEKGRRKIENALDETKKHFGITTNNDWLKRYYQLANRLAFIYFLYKQNITAHILNIYFLNGYKKNGQDKSVISEKHWDKVIKKEYEYLCIKDSEALSYVHSVYIDCNSK